MIRNEIEKLTSEQIKSLIGEEEYQRACSVAIDAYDKEGTFYDEVIEIIKKQCYDTRSK